MDASCAVYGCVNSTLTNTDPFLQFYVFPKLPVIVQQWIEACGWQSEPIDINLAKVCSVHFADDAYTTELKVIDCIACYTKFLKYDAIPTLYLPSINEIIIQEVKISQEDMNEMIVLTLPAAPQECASAPVEETLSEGDKEKYQHIQTVEHLTSLEKKNATLRAEIMRLETQLDVHKVALEASTQKFKDVQLLRDKARHEYSKKKRSLLSLHEQRRLLTKVFSPSQIKILCGKKKIYWSNDDMAVGYTIRHLSNRNCYMYLTKNLNIPLPAVSSVKRWMTLKDASMRKSDPAPYPMIEDNKKDTIENDSG